jgi:hypothetical protein
MAKGVVGSGREPSYLTNCSICKACTRRKTEATGEKPKKVEPEEDSVTGTPPYIHGSRCRMPPPCYSTGRLLFQPLFRTWAFSSTASLLALLVATLGVKGLTHYTVNLIPKRHCYTEIQSAGLASFWGLKHGSSTYQLGGFRQVIFPL